jgi:alginate O-acetyltransferase complex protein AlgI
MLFNSYEFIFVFLPITFFVYFYLNQKKLTELSKVFLVFSSLFFYSWWNITYLPILIASLTFNYAIGRSLNKTVANNKNSFTKKSILICGITLNLTLLGYFKYADFFIKNINIVFNFNTETTNILLPLAISFFTFQQIAYLVDCYRKETKEYSFLNYALFVSFFPQLIAGPIVHHKEMMPQFTSTRGKVKHYRNIAMGLFIFSIGLFKKVVIADTFAVWATQGFDVASTLNLFEAWATSLSYTFQLYFDFSGYTDMAIGLALLFNIRLPINFNSPYKATNIQDFWRRWHITLSRFLRDYIYIPLGGNKKGEWRTYTNLMATFLLGGLWHGAGWTFVFWGFLHGLAVLVQRLWSKVGVKLWTWLAWGLTFNFVNIAWIFFRAEDWEDAVKVLGSMFSLDNIIVKKKFSDQLSYLSEYNIKFGEVMKMTHDGSDIINWLIFSIILIFFCKNSIERIAKFKINFKTVSLAGISFTLGVLSLNKVSEFIYFNF